MKKIVMWMMVLSFMFTPILFSEDGGVVAGGTTAVPSTAASPTSVETATPEVKPEPVVRVEDKKHGCLNCPAEKLGRGVANIAYSTLELPYRIGKEMERTNYFAALPSGLLKGVVWTAYRLTAGAIDTATFIIPTKPFINEYDAGWWQA